MSRQDTAPGASAAIGAALYGLATRATRRLPRDMSLTSAATQTGPFMGMAPSGKRYEIEEIHWFRVRDGRIAEHWHQADFAGMRRQLGAG